MQGQPQREDPNGAIYHVQMLAGCALRSFGWGLERLADNVGHPNSSLCHVLTTCMKIRPGNRGRRITNRVEMANRLEGAR
jgi:hypothetical protein